MKGHVQIGTGKFGLGFVGHFSKLNSFNTTFLNREPKTEHSQVRNSKLREKKHYFIDYYDTNKSEQVPFEALYLFGIANKETENAISAMADPKTQLITLAV